MIEGYLRLLSRNPSLVPASTIEETFGYGDVLRGQSVQRALQASSARSGVKDPVLAQLVRASQDQEKQIGAAVATLNNLLSLPASERDEKAVKDTQAEIARFEATRTQAVKDIAKKFPQYGSLVNPPPPTPADLQKQLTADEAMLSFYFGRYEGFVWVLRKEGPVQFVRIGMSLGDLNSKVTKLREALEPNAAMISDIPAFDLKLAHELFESLLKPTEANWSGAKNLIVVTNGALGLLPLSLLPTAPAQITADDDPLFSSYRNVPWLARSHAVTLVPSISALATLRQLPVGSASRQQLIGFGDPLFSQEQADDAKKDDAAPVQVADAANVTRGVPLKRRNSPKLDGVDSVQLAQLPRLPDTRDELKSIALALQADPAKVLNLGKDANEKNVKKADLSKFKIIAFATHGLVPGELDGLTQPALALSAPAVADSDGDGLLDDGRDPVAEAECRLGRSVGLQHRRGRCRRGGSGLRPRPGFLLRRHARAACHQLVGAFAIGAAIDDGPVQAPRRRSKVDARRGDAAGDDGFDRWSGLCRRRRQNRIHLCPSAVLGPLFHHRRWWDAVAIFALGEFHPMAPRTSEAIRTNDLS